MYVMKRFFRIVCTVMLVSVCFSCSNRKTYRIGVSQCAGGRWREKVNHEMLAAQHLYEEDVKVSIACAYDDTELQIRQIDSLAQSGIDLLVVAPNEAAPIADAIARVRQKNIPVIFFDRKAETDDYTTFIGGNNVQVGQTVGTYALHLASRISGHKPVILEITATMATSPARERHEGFAKAMATRPGGQADTEYICSYSDWSSDQAHSIMLQQIESGVLPDIVFCHNDGMATGVYQAAVEAGLEDRFMILGIDGLPGEGIEYVQLGHQTGSYIYPTHGDKIIRLALDILTGKPFDRENTLQGMMVTPENVNIVDLNSRELIKQNSDLITIHDKLEALLVLYDTQKKILAGSFVAITILILSVILTIRAWRQTKKAIRQRQNLNEEETLFYTNADSRTIRQIFDMSINESQEPTDAEVSSPRSQDTIFAETLNKAIRKNIKNPKLRMENLGEEIGLGRVQLYRKVKAITGMAPVELLRQMRLQKGYMLLTTTNKTVAEIAYEVGFNTPGYFSKCFKEQYGKQPTDLRDNVEEKKLYS